MLKSVIDNKYDESVKMYDSDISENGKLISIQISKLNIKTLIVFL